MCATHFPKLLPSAIKNGAEGVWDEARFQNGRRRRNSPAAFATVHRVRTGPGKPGKSWNFILVFSRTGKFWKNATGPGKFWKSVELN